MKKISKISILVLSMFFLNTCSGLSEAGKVLRNEKVSTTDEFLVKKNDPLTVPPNLEKLPEPRTKESISTKDLGLENILEKEVKIKKSQDSRLEKMILNEIKK